MPPKRKSTHQDADAPPPRRSTRQRTTTAPAAAAAEQSKPATTSSKAKTQNKSKAQKKAEPPIKARVKASEPSEDDQGEKEVSAPASASKETKAREPAAKADKKKSAGEKKEAGEGSAGGEGADGNGRQYWLMRAEPETRLERGVDVSFSIDDLAARTEPEPWDGIRNYVARNNLRAMKKGDLAFFSHSNCKEPGIVGIMEIVKEHTPDLTAHDPKAAYYDPKSSPSDPKWSVVHVEFRSKFKVPVTVKEMREMAKSGGPLENMQMMKQSRLSVSRVSEAEWNHLMEVAQEKAEAAA